MHGECWGKMKIIITKPCRANILSGEIEVTENEANRLMLLGLAEIRTERIEPEKETKKKTTRKV